MKNGKTKAGAILLLFIYTFFSLLPISVSAKGEYATVSASLSEDSLPAVSEDIKISSRFLELITQKDNKGERMLAVGGSVFGIRIKENGVSVTETAGITPLLVNDRIISVGGKRVNSAEDVENAVKNSCGKPIAFEIVRNGETLKISITPKLDSGEYKLGVVLRSVASGIGTLTFIDPETGMFGGLGHGICNSSGELLSIESGESTNVVLGGIKKGESGKPGELSGALGKRSTGVILKNTDCGIFGVMENPVIEDSQLLPIGTHDEVKAGKATILSTVKNGRCCEYKIEIFDIDYDSEGSKSFKIKLCDDSLTALSGGIVRGMSGSPIIQNGKIVGAVTHVMVNDPLIGYGIFIENMLTEMRAK